MNQKTDLLATVAALKSQVDALAVEVIVQPPPPAPVPELDKYRYQQPYLFQTVKARYEPTRLADGYALDLDRGAPIVGPTYLYVDPLSGWAWDNPGGDYLDSQKVRQGTSPWFTINTNMASGSTAVYTYTVDITTMLKFIQSTNRWNAILLKPAASVFRTIATKFHSTAQPPRIDVTYVDGTKEVLNNRICAYNATGSAAPITTAAEINLPVFLEHDKPTKEVDRATLTFTITQHWSGSIPNVMGYVIDPNINVDPVQTGIANSATLDSGLVGHPDVFHVHRYVDGTSYSDFASALKLNTDDEANFSRHIYDPTVPSDVNLLPNVDYGKWIGANSQWSLLRSDTPGFKPLVPGMGAMRIEMPIEAAADGAVVGYSGTGGSNAFLYLPEEAFGLQRRLFVRHYVQIGTPDGEPYRMPLAKKYQVRHTTGSGPLWTDTGGKWGIMPDHMAYPDGGNSGASGGGYGWQMRLGWAEIYHDLTGPDLGGLGASLHTYDFQGNNPAGFRYGTTDQPKDTGLGQRGGLGSIIYAGKWYCVETEVLLNSVMPEAPGYKPDGEVRVWIDGRLALQRTGMVFRSLPTYIKVNGIPTTPTFKRAGMNRAVREVGHKGAWFNWFHGGLTKNSISRVLHITGVVVSRSYIGPMRLK